MLNDNPNAKLEHFTDVITKDALEESQKIWEELQRESTDIINAAEDEYLAETFRLIQREMAQIRTEAGRKISHRIMENKRALYLRREEMSADIMAQVRARVEAFVQTPAYVEQLCALYKRVRQAFGASAEILVYLRQADMHLAPVLQKCDDANACPARFAQGSFELGGLTASCPSRHLQIDESFDATLGELRGHFAEMFGLELAN